MEMPLPDALSSSILLRWSARGAQEVLQVYCCANLQKPLTAEDLIMTRGAG